MCLQGLFSQMDASPHCARGPGLDRKHQSHIQIWPTSLPHLLQQQRHPRSRTCPCKFSNNIKFHLSLGWVILRTNNTRLYLWYTCLAHAKWPPMVPSQRPDQHNAEGSSKASAPLSQARLAEPSNHRSNQAHKEPAAG
ncbi:hypothetical protein ID866_11538 [Astraeus odoratus]|nr:hypothetical protein ID866_11538 [Astraeus odoratus]